MRISRLMFGGLLAGTLAGTIADPRTGSAFGVHSGDAIDAVWSLLDAFVQRSASGYVAWMADDFVFVSDEQDFEAAHPFGMSRADERSFATHLFDGGGRGTTGAPLPIATWVDASAGPVIEVSSEGAQRRIVIERLHARIDFADGSTVDVGDTRNEMDVVLTEAGWRVRRWREIHLAPIEQDSLARRLADAASTFVRRDESACGPRTPRDGPTSVLVLIARVDRTRGALLFKIGLPRSGGVLELFDVVGRRISRQDLTQMPAGHHTVAMDGVSYPPGVYLARVRQGSESVATKLVLPR